jgi:ribosomal protein S18 acetylase RimI-like enzyme
MGQTTTTPQVPFADQVTALGYEKLLFVSANAFINPASPDRAFVKSMVNFLDKSHTLDYANALKQWVTLTYKNASPSQRQQAEFQVSGMCGFYVLIKDGKIVAVAQLDGGTSIVTVTVPKKERGKGHAKAILRLIAALFEGERICVFSPTYRSHERLLASAGWTRFDNVLAPDKTVDTMPEHSKEQYAVAMTRKDKVIYTDSEEGFRKVRQIILMNMALCCPLDGYEVPKK